VETRIESLPAWHSSPHPTRTCTTTRPTALHLNTALHGPHIHNHLNTSHGAMIRMLCCDLLLHVRFHTMERAFACSQSSLDLTVHHNHRIHTHATHCTSACPDPLRRGGAPTPQGYINRDQIRPLPQGMPIATITTITITNH